MIEIEIKDRSKGKEFLSMLHSKIEDLLFELLQKVPERFIPQPLMEWLDRYTTKRINQLKHQNIKNTWRNVHLEKVVNDINSRTQKEAPTDDELIII